MQPLITAPEASFFRTFNPADIDAMAQEAGMPADWRYPDDVRNALLRDFLEDLPKGDLWVFAYGSLMWDPGFHFCDLQKCFAPGYERRFILYDIGARGTVDNPAVLAALDAGGDGCHGMVFKIAADLIATEIDVIWRREQIAGAYDARIIDVEAGGETRRALAFTANHDDRNIRADLTRDQQITALATASGILGPNLDYIVNLKTHFDALGIADTHVDDLHAAALARVAALGPMP